MTRYPVYDIQRRYFAHPASHMAHPSETEHQSGYLKDLPGYEHPFPVMREGRVVDVTANPFLLRDGRTSELTPKGIERISTLDPPSTARLLLALEMSGPETRDYNWANTVIAAWKQDNKNHHAQLLSELLLYPPAGEHLDQPLQRFETRAARFIAATTPPEVLHSHLMGFAERISAAVSAAGVDRIVRRTAAAIFAQHVEFRHPTPEKKWAEAIQPLLFDNRILPETKAFIAALSAASYEWSHDIPIETVALALNCPALPETAVINLVNLSRLEAEGGSSRIFAHAEKLPMDTAHAQFWRVFAERLVTNATVARLPNFLLQKMSGDIAPECFTPFCTALNRMLAFYRDETKTQITENSIRTIAFWTVAGIRNYHGHGLTDDGIYEAARTTLSLLTFDREPSTTLTAFVEQQLETVRKIQKEAACRGIVRSIIDARPYVFGRDAIYKNAASLIASYNKSRDERGRITAEDVWMAAIQFPPHDNGDEQTQSVIEGTLAGIVHALAPNQSMLLHALKERTGEIAGQQRIPEQTRRAAERMMCAIYVQNLPRTIMEDRAPEPKLTAYGIETEDFLPLLSHPSVDAEAKGKLAAAMVAMDHIFDIRDTPIVPWLAFIYEANSPNIQRAREYFLRDNNWRFLPAFIRQSETGNEWQTLWQAAAALTAKIPPTFWVEPFAEKLIEAPAEHAASFQYVARALAHFVRTNPCQTIDCYLIQHKTRLPYWLIRHALSLTAAHDRFRNNTERDVALICIGELLDAFLEKYPEVCLDTYNLSRLALRLVAMNASSKTIRAFSPLMAAAGGK